MYTVPVKMPIQAKQLIATFEKGEPLATTNGDDSIEAVSTEGHASNGPKLNREMSLEELAQPGTARRLLIEFESKAKQSGSAGELTPKSPGLRINNRLSAIAITEATVETTINAITEATVTEATVDTAANPITEATITEATVDTTINAITEATVTEATVEATGNDVAASNDGTPAVVEVVDVDSSPNQFSATAPYKLIYFPVRGRSAHIRYLCADNGLPLEIETITETWPAIKSTTPLGQLPVLKDGDYELAQSNAILRYLATKHDLYGSDEKERGLIDMINDHQEDLRGSYARLIYGDYDTGKEAYIQRLPELLAPLEKVLTKNNNGTGFLVGDKISYVDYTVFDILDNISILSPESLGAFPNLTAFHGRIAARPKLASFRESDEFKKLPINGNGKQ